MDSGRKHPPRKVAPQEWPHPEVTPGHSSTDRQRPTSSHPSWQGWETPRDQAFKGQSQDGACGVQGLGGAPWATL